MAERSRSIPFVKLASVNRTFRFADILDGTSNTVVIAETDSYGYKWGAFHTSGTGVRRLRGGESVFRSAFVYTGSLVPTSMGTASTNTAPRVPTLHASCRGTGCRRSTRATSRRHTFSNCS